MHALKTGWVSKWTREELIKLVASKTFTPLIKTFFSILATSDTWVPKSLIDRELKRQGFKVAPATVAGITAPITRLCRQKGKDPLFQKKVQENELHYRINALYLPILKPLLT